MAKNTPNTHTIILHVVVLEKIITKKVIDEQKTRGIYATPLFLFSVGKRGLVLEGLMYVYGEKLKKIFLAKFGSPGVP